MPLKHPPGEAQFDFGFAYVKIDGIVTKIAFAGLSLPYGNVRYCRIFPGECTESFQEGLKRAFLFPGGERAVPSQSPSASHRPRVVASLDFPRFIFSEKTPANHMSGFVITVRQLIACMADARRILKR